MIIIGTELLSLGLPKPSVFAVIGGAYQALQAGWGLKQLSCLHFGAVLDCNSFHSFPFCGCHFDTAPHMEDVKKGP